jgi:DNA repair exonuclease SbcCD ATPase subunit
MNNNKGELQMTDKITQAKGLIEKIRGECAYLENEMRSQCDRLEDALDNLDDGNKWEDAVADTVGGCNTGLGGQIALIDSYIQELSKVIEDIDPRWEAEA